MFYLPVRGSAFLFRRRDMIQKKPRYSCGGFAWKSWVGLPIVFFGFGLFGCAYHAGVGDRQIPGGYRQIAVPIFKNHTAETGVEVYFTNAMKREIKRAKIGQIVDKSAAQVTLEGDVTSVDYLPSPPIQGSENSPLHLPPNAVLSTEYRIFVNVALTLRRNADEKVLWQGQFSKERVYSAPRIGSESINALNALYNHSARYKNIDTMSSEMMAEAHDRLTENF